MVQGEDKQFNHFKFDVFLNYREPRSKIRHQGFHPFAFGPRFPADPLIPFKLGELIFYLT